MRVRAGRHMRGWALVVCLWAVFALSQLCYGIALADEDDAAGEDASNSASIVVSVSFVGPDDEEWDREDALVVPPETTAWQATTMALSQSSLFYNTWLPSSSNVIVSLTRDIEDEPLAFDPSTGSGWHLYLNDKHRRAPATELGLDDGDEVSWRYEVGTFYVTVSVVGPGGTGYSYWVHPTRRRVNYGDSVWDASLLVFHKKGYQEGRLLSYTTGDDGTVELQSLAALGENGITGEMWRPFVNGEPVDDVAHAELHAGDSICWYYAGNGEQSLPDFVEKSGAASQSPASLVHIDGDIVQFWAKPVVRQDGTLTGLGYESGLRLSGDGTLAEMLSSDVALPGNLVDIASRGVWQKSLACVLDEVVFEGGSGRASQSRDGGVCYLDDTGEVHKLGVL